MKKHTYLAPEINVIATEQADVLTFSYQSASDGDYVLYGDGFVIS